jgi:hypothetical protein
MPSPPRWPSIQPASATTVITPAQVESPDKTGG